MTQNLDKMFLRYLTLVLIICPLSFLNGQQTKLGEIDSHNSIQLEIDKIIAKDRIGKIIESTDTQSVNRLLDSLNTFWLEKNLSITFSNLNSLNSLYIQNAKKLLESARDGKRYSDNAILAYEYAASKLYNAKIRLANQIIRNTILSTKKAVDTTYSNTNIIRDTVKNIKDSILNHTSNIEENLACKLDGLNWLVKKLQPKKNLSNYLIYSGILLPNNLRGGFLGAYIRLKSESNAYWGINTLISVKEDGSSQTALQAGFNIDLADEHFFFNFGGGFTWEEISSRSWIGTVGGGIIYKSKSYWNPRVGIQYHLGNTLQGLGLQVILPVGVKY